MGEDDHGDGDNEGGGDDDDGRISPPHPRPIFHTPRDNISRNGNPSRGCPDSLLVIFSQRKSYLFKNSFSDPILV